jgi:hypothetical protein
MPEVTKVFTIDITPERFIDACSDSELKELDILLQSPRFQQRLKATEIGFKSSTSKDKPSKNQHQEEQE